MCELFGLHFRHQWSGKIKHTGKLMFKVWRNEVINFLGISNWTTDNVCGWLFPCMEVQPESTDRDL